MVATFGNFWGLSGLYAQKPQRVCQWMAARRVFLVLRRLSGFVPGPVIPRRFSSSSLPPSFVSGRSAVPSFSGQGV